MPSSHRIAAACSAAALALPAVLLPAAALADPTDPVVLADTSAYLLEQLDPDTALVENEEFGFTDHGLTADIVLALLSTGAASDQVATTTSALAEADQVEAYVTGETGTDRYAGSFAKLALTLQATGDDPSDVDGRDLLAELTALAAPADDPEAGRFRDESEFGDFSSVTSQSLALLTLTVAGQDLPDGAVDFLLADQCDTGGFTNPFGDAPDCDGEPDATGFAVQALVAVGEDDAAADAAAWLQDTQLDDGSWETTDEEGDTVANANSTALASQALTAVGADTDGARAFLVGLQDDDGCGLRYAADDEAAGERATAQAVPALAEATFLALATGDHDPVGVDAVCGEEATDAETTDEAADTEDGEAAAEDDEVAADDDGEVAAEPGRAALPIALIALLVVLATLGIWLATRRSGGEEAGG